VGKNYVGHVFWSMKSLMNNKGGISNALVKNFYQEPALVPPMPWISNKPPATPNVKASGSGKNVSVTWSPITGCQKYAIQVRVGETWRMRTVTAGTKITLTGVPDAIAVSAVDRHGNTSPPRVLTKQ
jgi:hypothetical protein